MTIVPPLVGVAKKGVTLVGLSIRGVSYKIFWAFIWINNTIIHVSPTSKGVTKRGREINRWVYKGRVLEKLLGVKRQCFKNKLFLLILVVVSCENIRRTLWNDTPIDNCHSFF